MQGKGGKKVRRAPLPVGRVKGSRTWGRGYGGEGGRAVEGLGTDELGSGKGLQSVCGKGGEGRTNKDVSEPGVCWKWLAFRNEGFAAI